MYTIYMYTYIYDIFVYMIYIYIHIYIQYIYVYTYIYAFIYVCDTDIRTLMFGAHRFYNMHICFIQSKYSYLDHTHIYFFYSTF